MPPISLERANDLSEIVRKQYDEVGSCKKCVRKDPNILTTFEMDGLFTQKDIDNRHLVMVQCIDCKKWTQQNIRNGHYKYSPCSSCGNKRYNPRSAISLRTFDPNRKKTKDFKDVRLWV